MLYELKRNALVRGLQIGLPLLYLIALGFDIISANYTLLKIILLTFVFAFIFILAIHQAKKPAVSINEDSLIIKGAFYQGEKKFLNKDLIKIIMYDCDGYFMKFLDVEYKDQSGQKQTRRVIVRNTTQKELREFIAFIKTFSALAFEKKSITEI